MKIIALDATEQGCSVALLSDGTLREIFKIAPRSHAQLILPMVQELLAEFGITLSQLDAIAFARGPGAFTGLRISASIVQGLAVGADLGVAPISTLQAMAEGVWQEQRLSRVVTALDARMGEVYIGGFQREADYQYRSLIEEQVAVPEAIVYSESLVTKGCFELGVGSGWVYSAELHEKLADCVPFATEVYSHAKYVAQLAQLSVSDNRLVAAEEAIPVYLRDNVARVSH